MTILGHLYILPLMKPDKNVCLNCGKEISSRAKYCTEACRKQYARNPDKRADKPNPDMDISLPGHANPDKLRDYLTKTDKTFYDRAMKDFGEPYYNFDWAERSVKCSYCETAFKTKLRLNRYCSYKHFKEAITVKL